MASTPVGPGGARAKFQKAVRTIGERKRADTARWRAINRSARLNKHVGHLEERKDEGLKGRAARGVQDMDGLGDDSYFGTQSEAVEGQNLSRSPSKLTGRRASRAASAEANFDAYDAYRPSGTTFEGTNPLGAQTPADYDAYAAYGASETTFEGSNPVAPNRSASKSTGRRAAEDYDAYGSYGGSATTFEGQNPLSSH